MEYITTKEIILVILIGILVFGLVMLGIFAMEEGGKNDCTKICNSNGQGYYSSRPAGWSVGVCLCQSSQGKINSIPM